MNEKNKIERLRCLMKNNNINYYYVPHEDEHLTEYVSENRERLQWISGFSGSAGSFLIGLKNTYLFVDGRYSLQAKHQMSGIKCKILNIKENNFIHFLQTNINRNDTISFDNKLITHKSFNLISEACNLRSIKVVIPKKI